MYRVLAVKRARTKNHETVAVRAQQSGSDTREGNIENGAGTVGRKNRTLLVNCVAMPL